MRTIIIGDVHGCLDELQTLVSRCGYAAGDRLILVGDLVAKGPDSLGVVAWARESGAEAVLGNHEEHVLRARRGMTGVKPKHQRLAEAFGSEDAAWLEARPLFLPAGELHGKPLVVVHARGSEGAPWASLWSGPERIVFGHDSLRGLQQCPWALGLDTGWDSEPARCRDSKSLAPTRRGTTKSWAEGAGRPLCPDLPKGASLKAIF